MAPMVLTVLLFCALARGTTETPPDDVGSRHRVGSAAPACSTKPAPADAGIALLAVQYRRTLTNLNSDGESGPSTSGGANDTANDNSTKGDSKAPSLAAEVAPPAANVEAAPPATNSSKELSGPQYPSYSLNVAGDNSHLSRSPASGNRASSRSASANPPSSSSASANLASSSSSASGSPVNSKSASGSGELDTDTKNASGSPLSPEKFEPFGYPGAGLLLELHMPEVTLRELHASSRGSLAQFLLEIRGEIGKASEVDETRISILGIHGRYKRYDGDGFFRVSSTHESALQAPAHVDEEVVVRFELLPGWPSDSDPRQALNALREQLSESGSAIMHGPLGTILANATVTSSALVGVATQPRMAEHRGMAHMSAMAWPIGISAAFIGVLIWLAAY